jgi:hypothetical protein
MISLEKQFLFVHVPKTAGNALQNILRRYSEDRITADDPRQDGTERFEVRSDRFHTHKHSTICEYRRQLGPEYDRLFKFCVVRNPWERVVSHYSFLQQHVPTTAGSDAAHKGAATIDRRSLLKFIDKAKPLEHYTTWRRRRLTRVCRSPRSNPLRQTDIDYFIRYENLQEDFARVCQLLGMSDAELTVRNRSQHRPYWEYYDADTRAKVGHRFRHEIEYFGYDFEACSSSERQIDAA